MANDLWQLVKARDLKPGDVGFWCLEPRRVVSAEIIAGDRMEIMYAYRTGGMKAELHPDDVVVRRYTGPSPEVLMLALKMAEKNSVVEDSFGRQCQGPLAEDYIQLAEAEIAKERTDA